MLTLDLWIPLTIFAAFMQNLRSSLQKHLKSRLSTTGATFARFVYAVPLALTYLLGLCLIGGYDLPRPTVAFLVLASIGGIAQILATALLVYLFSFRNFAIGTTFSKTETLQTALFGVIVLGESVGLAAIAAMAIGLGGIVMISVTRLTSSLRGILSQCFEAPALIGMASGALFGLSAVTYRAASLALDDGDFVIRAACTLGFVTMFQTLIMVPYMARREPGQIRAVWRSWRVSGLVGLAGMLGSVGWITAMTLYNAAYVRALGQIELVFTFAASYIAFKEKPNRMEIAGVALVTASILLLLLSR